MRGICAVLLVAGALLLGGCGSQGSSPGTETSPADSGPPRKVTVTLDGHEGPENVGILMAQQRGYFADANLSVSIQSPTAPARPVRNVADRQDDFGLTQEPQVVLANIKGAPVIAVGTLVRQATASMIWLKRSRISSIGDLKGKTVAIPGVPFQKDFLANVLARNGLTLGDVKVKNVGYGLVPALVSGRADAIFGGSWNLEGVELESRGLKPVVTRVQALGIPTYDEGVMIARTDRVAKDPRMIQDFMSAVLRGNAAAANDPKAAVEAIEKADLGGSRPSRKTLEAEVAATLPLLSKSGYMFSAKSIGLTDWMHAQGLIHRSPRPPELLTNDFATWRP